MYELRQITVKGFKSLRDVNIELKKLNILVGANSSGKSNFISLFKFLNEYIEERLQNYVAISGGAESLLYYGSKETKVIEITTRHDSNALKLTLEPTSDNRLIIKNETPCYYHHNQEFSYSTHHTQYETGIPGRRKSEKPVGYVYNAILSWKLYHFHDTSTSAPMKKPCDIADNEYFRQNGENLSAFLYLLKEKHLSNYEKIRDVVRLVFPDFNDFLLRPIPTNDTKIQLEWYEKNSDYPFQSYHLSDGTLRFICLATLLLQPQPPSTVIIDEPELGLHPYALTLLASLLKGASTESQILVSTQSVTLLNHFQPKDIVVVERENKETKLKRLSADSLQEWMDEYSLGELWEKNLIGGRP